MKQMIAVVVAAVLAVVPADPTTRDWLCNNPAFSHMHPAYCADAIPPQDWDD